MRRAEVQYQNAKEDIPRTTDRAARSMIKLFNIDDVSWQDDMAQVEKIIEALKDDKEVAAVTQNYTMSHTGDGLRYRLQATGGHDLVQREDGVQHRPKAKIARAKIVKNCKCCCSSHCLLIDHAFRYTYSEKENQAENYYGLLDRSWRSTAQYEEEMLDIDQEFVYEDFVSLLTKVNTDLGVSDVDQDSAVLNTDVQGDHADLPGSL